MAPVRLIEESTVADFDFAFGVNMRGVFLVCCAVMPAMKASGGGAIVNIASASDLEVVMPWLSLGSASKTAVPLSAKAAA